MLTDYIQKKRGEPGLFFFEYNLLPKLISNFLPLHGPGIRLGEIAGTEAVIGKGFGKTRVSDSMFHVNDILSVKECTYLQAAAL